MINEGQKAEAVEKEPRIKIKALRTIYVGLGGQPTERGQVVECNKTMAEKLIYCGAATKELDVKLKKQPPTGRRVNG